MEEHKCENIAMRLFENSQDAAHFLGAEFWSKDNYIAFVGE